MGLNEDSILLLVLAAAMAGQAVYYRDEPWYKWPPVAILVVFAFVDDGDGRVVYAFVAALVLSLVPHTLWVTRRPGR